MEFFGLLFGLLALGYGIFFLVLPFVIRSTWRRVSSLERKLGDLEGALQAQSGPPHRPGKPAEAPPGPEPVTPEAVTAPVVGEVPGTTQPVSAPAGTAEATPRREAGVAAEPTAAPDEAQPPSAAWSREPGEAAEGTGWQPAATPAILEHVRSWLLGGNTVARVGIIILLLGVAFFLKYAVDRGWLPIELRLAGAALGGLALIATGWRSTGAGLARPGHSRAPPWSGSGCASTGCWRGCSACWFRRVPALPS